jgi:hypothetical protein
MRKNLRNVVIAIVVVAGVGLVALGALALYANSEYTVCYGIFESRETAEDAADAGRREGFDVYVDHRASESAVEFESGETGQDAGAPRDAFREILAREGGVSGHGDSGCLERGPFDH